MFLWSWCLFHFPVKVLVRPLENKNNQIFNNSQLQPLFVNIYLCVCFLENILALLNYLIKRVNFTVMNAYVTIPNAFCDHLLIFLCSYIIGT